MAPPMMPMMPARGAGRGLRGPVRPMMAPGRGGYGYGFPAMQPVYIGYYYPGAEYGGDIGTQALRSLLIIRPYSAS